MAMYWEKRIEKLNDNVFKDAEEYVKELREIYDSEIDKIQEKIYSHLTKLQAEAGGISLYEAKKLLNNKELDLFKMGLDEFRKKSQEFITPDIERELNIVSRRVRISRLQAMEIELKKTVSNLMSREEKGLFIHLEKTYENKFYKELYELQRITGYGKVQGVNKNLLETILNNPWTSDGKEFSERIWGRGDRLVNSLTDNLTRDVARGASPDESIKNIAKEFDASKANAGRLVMTETAAISSKATLDSYKELGVERYEILATLDLKTSEICRNQDNKVYDIKDYMIGITAPPFHPNCRTTTVPYFDDDIQKRLDAEVGRMARDVETGKSVRVESLNYKEWHEKYVVDKKYKKGYNINNSDGEKSMIDINIDCFTNCLLDRSTKEEIDTIVEKINPKNKDLKDWNFNWNKPYNEGYSVKALKVLGLDDIQGLIATKIDLDGGVYINIVESAPHNIGHNGKYEGVGAHLFAIACKEARDNGMDFVYFDAKTNLIQYYKEKLGASQIGSTQRMFIDGNAFEELIETYFKEG